MFGGDDLIGGDCYWVYLFVWFGVFIDVVGGEGGVMNEFFFLLLCWNGVGNED